MLMLLGGLLVFVAIVAVVWGMPWLDKKLQERKLNRACDELFSLISDRTNKCKSVGRGYCCINIRVEHGDREIIEGLLDENGKFRGFEVMIRERDMVVPQHIK